MEMMQGECFAMPVQFEKGADQKNQIRQIESLHSKGKVGTDLKQSSARAISEENIQA